ncbi:hypothetical protein M8J77_015597 [Diaphorina citri]|nr:hypothetical protein M8J77_015597 [Diaphorina citri]
MANQNSAKSADLWDAWMAESRTKEGDSKRPDQPTTPSSSRDESSGFVNRRFGKRLYRSLILKTSKAIGNVKNNLLKCQEPETRGTRMVKRFSPLQWLLHSCCNIATTDDTDELFHTQHHLSAHVENLQLAVHNEHRNVIQAVSNMEELTEQFNTITGEEEMNFPR